MLLALASGQTKIMTLLGSIASSMSMRGIVVRMLQGTERCRCSPSVHTQAFRMALERLTVSPALLERHCFQPQPRSLQ